MPAEDKIRVEVTDIETDPLWEDYKHLALPLGLRACWSSPIKAADGRVIGAFAFYYPRPRGPTQLERQVVSTCLHLCMIALENEETRSRAYEQAYTDPLTHLPNRARFQQRIGEIRDFIAEGREQYGMQTFDQHLADLVTQGAVSFDVALTASTRPADFELKMNMFREGDLPNSDELVSSGGRSNDRGGKGSRKR